jgi:hypothetical protein
MVDHGLTLRKGELSFYQQPFSVVRGAGCSALLENHGGRVIESVLSDCPAIPYISMTYWWKSGRGLLGRQ